MSTIALPENATEDVTPTGGLLTSFARRHVGQWLDLCDTFLDLQQKHVLQGEPSLGQMAEHRKALKYMLQGARLLQSQAKDPDFPDRALARALAIRLRQLEESWQMIHEPLPEAEADKILSQVFPNEP